MDGHFTTPPSSPHPLKARNLSLVSHQTALCSSLHPLSLIPSLHAPEKGLALLSLHHPIKLM